MSCAPGPVKELCASFPCWCGQGLLLGWAELSPRWADALSLCVARIPNISLGGIGGQGIKTCSVLITDQNEKLAGGRGGGSGVNSQQSCAEGLHAQAAAPSTPRDVVETRC